ncbi:MAG: cytochrome o ubiquinol oxidase subunit IV [Rhizobiales bacterium]|nr:cytochrome o ubiquinol oxidase subunit IV [Hyphomicrobiales bacterium]
MKTPARNTHAKFNAYMTGFVLAVILTAVPFVLVSFRLVSATTTLVVIAILALIQVLVHLRYFLHLDFKDTPRENLVTLAFTAVLIVIMIGGSLWIMVDLNARMMP